MCYCMQVEQYEPFYFNVPASYHRQRSQRGLFLDSHTTTGRFDSVDGIYPHPR